MSTIRTAFEEEDQHSHEENGNDKKLTHEDGAVLNVTSSAPPTYTSHVKNGTTTYNNRRSAKPGGVCSRITKDTLFRVFLLLLILALLIPILVLVALIYQQGTVQDDDAGGSRVASGLIANPDRSKSGAGEDSETPSAKNGKVSKQEMEDFYKKEPWRRQPTAAWRQLGSTLSESIDPRGDACTDFYGYSCDQWKDRNPLKDRKEISEETLAYENVKALILQTFDGMKKDDSSWPESVRWAKSYFDQCTTVDDAELAERKKSIVDLLRSIFPVGSQPQRAMKRRARNAEETQHEMTSHANMTDHTMEADHANASLHEAATAIMPVIRGNDTEGTTPVFATAPPAPVENATGTPEPRDRVHAGAPVETDRINETHVDNTTHVDAVKHGDDGTPLVQHTEPTQSSQVGRDLWELAGDVCQAGAVSFFDVDFSKNPKNSDDLKTILRPPTLTLPNRRYYSEPYLSSKKLPELQDTIIDTVKQFKTTPGSESALFPADAATTRDIVQFEQALAKASPTTRPVFDFDFDELQTHFPNAKTYSLSNLESRWPRVNWDAFLPEQVKKGGNQSNNATPIIVTDPAYVDQLVGLLADYDRQTVVNFLKWRYIYSVAGHLKKDDTLNSTCYDDLENDMPLALAHVVYKTNYGVSQDEKSKMIYTPESVQTLFNRTVRAFKSIAEYSGQINNASRKSISDELGNRVLITDWPDIIKDGKALDGVYAGLQASQNGTFIDQLNALRSSVFLDDQANVWSNVIPAAFTATQYVAGKTIAMVNDPRIINSQLSQAAIGQYATAGWQMGRELAKSVRYLPKAPFQSSRVDQCLINQYNQFCYPSPINSCVDGTWTLCDNVADTVGLEVAYRAYKTWESNMATAGDNDAFPAYLASSNLGKFTLDQIFFLAYGTSFCDNEAKEYTIDSLASEETAPQEYRLQGTVLNSNDFQLAFHCKAGDKLYSNPRERCQFV